MSSENPYAAPEAELIPIDEVSRDDPLAGRFTRLAAAMVDGIIGLAISLPIMYLLGIFNNILQGKNPPFWLLLVASVLGFLGFLLVQGYLLKTKGQTVGKKLAGIRITDLEGNVPEFGKVILLRYLPISIVSLIPLLGAYLPLLDEVFIFRGDRRCIHDLLAGTKVLVAEKGR